MNKKQISKTVYTKPEIEVMHILIESHLLDASYPGDHQKGDHKQGPAEEGSSGAKVGDFDYSESNVSKAF